MALGNVHHEFVQMLHARQALCRGLARTQVDTTAAMPEEVAAEIAASR